MSTNALIRRRGVTRTGATAATEETEARRSGARVLARLGHGTLVSGEPDQIAKLEKAGYRVITYPETNLLRVGDWTLDIEKGPAKIPRSLRVPIAERPKWPHHLVQLAGPPTSEWLSEIEERGLNVVHRVSRYAVFVSGDAGKVEGLKDLPFVSWTGPLEPAFRVDAKLSKQRGRIRHVRIGVYPPEEADELRETLKELGAEIVNEQEVNPTYHGQAAWFLAVLRRRDIAKIAGLPHVIRVEYAPPKEYDGERETQILAEGFDGVAAPNTGTVVGYQPFLTGVGANGNGVTVAICDSGVDTGANVNATGHLDLRGRQAAFVDYTGGANTADPVGHGTHVAGIAAGNAATGLTEAAAPNNFLWGQGTAPAARFVNQQMGNSPIQPAGGYQVLTTDAVTNGAVVQNNSWNGPPSGYDADCVTYDQLVRDPDPNTAALDHLCIVFSAGNGGGFPQTIGNPAEAKNVITVGNSLTPRPGFGTAGDDVRGLSGSSARGPTPDGRLKPEVIAPGTDVPSTYALSGSFGPPVAGVGTPDPANPGALINRYIILSGTSMSAPHVTGCCALLTEWWRGRTGGRNPSPAMLKALLVNGAEDTAGGQNWKGIPGSRFAATAGSPGTFQCNNLGYVPQQVLDQQQAMTQVASQAAVNANGRWFYDAANDRLFVRRVGGGAPAANRTQIWALDTNAIANVPNNDQGWGRVSLPNMMLQVGVPGATPGANRGPKIFSDQRHAFTANGEEVMFRVAPMDTTRPLRITLTWTDAPAAAGANPALMNDLDLEVTAVATGNLYRGNNFTNGFSTTGGAADQVNVVECVYIQNPNGVYEVTVIASSLTANARPPFDNTPWQDFALVIDNAVFANADPVNVSLIVDRSTSMVSSGYVGVTRTTSKQFIDLLGVDDRVGVVSFGNRGKYEYPAGGGTAQLITGAGTKNTAKSEVDGINFSGCTYMGDGLNKGLDLLTGLTGTRAMVLLSDGYDNKGCDRTNPAKPWAVDVAAGLPADVAVYSCAMGPASDQSVLESVADLTDGKYYYMPNIDDLYEIYNYIRGQITGEGIIVNDSSTASHSRLGSWVDCGASRVTFATAWGDKSIRYVNHEPRRGSHISVRLRDPRGRLLHPDTGYVTRTIGDGYVIFSIDEPLPGRWYVEVTTERNEHVKYTVGGFVDSPIQIKVSPPKTLVVGHPFEAYVRVMDGKVPIPDAKAKTVLVSPPADLKDIVRKYRRQLAGIRVSRDTLKDGMPRELAQLLTLRERRLKDGRGDILAHRVQRLAVSPVTDRLAKPLRKVREPAGTGTVSAGSGSIRVNAAPGVPPSAGVTPAASPPLIADLSSAATIIGRRMPDVTRILTQPYTMKIPAVTKVAGSANLLVTVYGTSPMHGCRFVRKALVSMVAREG